MHRILTTHAGSLPRPDDLRALVTAKAGGLPYAEDALTGRVRSAVAEIVRKQVESGIDSVKYTLRGLRQYRNGKWRGCRLHGGLCSGFR